VVVTITAGGYAKRTKTDLYRLQNRGGKGVRGAQLRDGDFVEHLFPTTSHHWILFFTTAGRVYRTKAYQLPEAGRDAKGSHVAGLLSFQPDEQIAQVLAVRDYDQAPYLVLATKRGLVKKTRLTDYNSPRQAGVIAINFRDEDDELIGAELVSPDDDLLLISRKAQAIRFRADDTQLRPMGRATSGVTGMKFRGEDQLLSMTVIHRDADAHEGADELYVFTVTDGGFAKKTTIDQYRLQGRGGLGIKAMEITEKRGELVGGLVLKDSDDVISITQSGQVTRSLVSGVPAKGRGTMGVSFVKFKGDDRVVTIARNAELPGAEETSEIDEAGDSAVEDAPSGDLEGTTEPEPTTDA
jgi:DNA gyrase subunit A